MASSSALPPGRDYGASARSSEGSMPAVPKTETRRTVTRFGLSIQGLEIQPDAYRADRQARVEEKRKNAALEAANLAARRRAGEYGRLPNTDAQLTGPQAAPSGPPTQPPSKKVVPKAGPRRKIGTRTCGLLRSNLVSKPGPGQLQEIDEAECTKAAQELLLVALQLESEGMSWSQRFDLTAQSHPRKQELAK